MNGLLVKFLGVSAVFFERIIQPFFPRSQKISFSVSQIKPIEKEVAPLDFFDFSSYQTSLQKIRASINDQQGFVAPKSVLYFMAGTDAGASLSLFPEASFYIHVDRNPFLKRSLFLFHEDNLKYSNFPVGRNFRDAHDTEKDNTMARLMATIQACHGATRFLEVGIFADDQDKEIPKMHGWITFDHGEGSSPKTLLHIQETIPGRFSAFSLDDSWWRFIESFAPEVLIVKGAMGVARPEKMNGILRSALKALLEKSKGSVVEGVDEYFHVDDSEKVYRFAKNHPKVPFEFSGLVSPQLGLVLDEVLFGYKGVVRFSLMRG